MRPDRLEDLIAAGALYRPGPMANIPDYCRRKHGEAWEPVHPELMSILGETYGIMVYQEQVMQIAQKMGGYRLGAADLLRRAMGKKIRAEMEQQREIFTKGARERGIPKAKAAEVFDLMAKFADYGFNKSHAAAYALVSYQTAWMKANHPVAFLAACMNLALANTDKIAALRQEAQRMGIAVLPPDINRSGATFQVEVAADGTQSIRYALAAVKKVGQAAMTSLAAARGAKPFADLADLAARIDPKQLNKMQLENLARAGAFDAMNRNRRQVFEAAETVLRRAQADAQEAESGQIGMFGGAAKPETLRLPQVVDWPEMDRLGFEAEAIGFHLTAHPLDSYGPVLKRLGAVPSSQLEPMALRGTTRARVAGCVVASKERSTRTGSRMAWIRLSDAGGSFEVTVFSEVLNGAREALKAGSAVLMGIELKLDGDSVRVTATDCRSLEQAAAEAGAGMRIWLDKTEAVPHIRALLAKEARGRGQVTLVPRIDDAQAVEITLPGRFMIGPRLAQAMMVVPGVERVEEV
jgi:DNA polymerase-3 subunit alpha